MNEPNEIELTPCTSSLISGYRYDDAHWTLTIQFRGKTPLTKCYQGVEPEFYEEFLAAKSKGQFFNARMKHKYQSLVIEWEIAVHAETAKSSFEERAGEVTKEVVKQYAHLSEVGTWPEGGVPEPDRAPKNIIAMMVSTDDGEVLPPLEPPTTVTEALKVLSEQSGIINATIEQNGRIAKESLAVRVTDADSYAKAGDTLKFLTTVKDRSTGFLTPIKALLYKPYEMALAKLKAATDPIDTALSHVKRQRIDWSAEQERVRLAVQARLRREQAEQEERERQAAGQQMTWTELDDKLAAGDLAGAERLIEEPINVPGTYQAPVSVPSAVPKEESISSRRNWKAVVEDFEAVVLDVAEGIKSIRAGKGLAGHAPVTFLKIDQPKINQSAKSQEKAMQYPGIKAWNDASESVRRAK